MSDTLDDNLNKRFLISSFTRPRYLEFEDALNALLPSKDQGWTLVDCAIANNKAVIEPLVKGQIFRLYNYNAGTVIYIRRPRSDDVSQFYIESNTAPGFVTTNLLPIGTGLTIKLPNIGASTVRRMRFIWDGTNVLLRAVQVRLG